MGKLENVIECIEKAMLFAEGENERMVTIGYGVMEDALALLKAQEPVEPYTKRDGRTTFFLCGGCNKPLCIAKDSYKPKHCPECGREVKWG